ncbi:MAG: pentapeptide repeat-containing protein [Rivularia sp. (in: cyanobacteria)]|jgi:uncharacterized protein YjbI with pentapeptide repeats
MTGNEFLESYAAGERDFSGIDLSGIDLFYTNLENTNFSRANLSRVYGRNFHD